MGRRCWFGRRPNSLDAANKLEISWGLCQATGGGGSWRRKVPTGRPSGWLQGALSLPWMLVLAGRCWLSGGARTFGAEGSGLGGAHLGGLTGPGAEVPHRPGSGVRGRGCLLPLLRLRCKLQLTRCQGRP